MKNDYRKIVVFIFILGIFFPARNHQSFAVDEPNRFQIAQKISKDDIEKYKKMADEYMKKKRGENGSTSDDSSNNVGDNSGNSTNTGSDSSSNQLTDQPSTPVNPESPIEPDKDSTKIDPKDQQYCEVHMKLAARHFKANNIERAKEEIKEILKVISFFPPARFMKAVIAAKEKNYLDAWRNIDVAQKHQPNNPKIKEFIDKLQKVSPKPAVLPEEDLNARPNPEHASELAMDAIESLLQQKSVGGKFTSISCGDYSEKDGKVLLPLKFEGFSSLDPSVIEQCLKQTFKGDVQNTKTGTESKILEYSVQVGTLPMMNPKVKPISGLIEFLKNTSEETDVAIKDSSESDIDGENRVMGTYNVVAGNLRSLNDFFRKISPYALKYSIAKINSSMIGVKSVWKGDIKIQFKVEKDK